ncbi:hypothetical protein WI38_27915 [Burkholderia ubonensis]|uniref:Uncharacterized protein n=1 Tax=Burkholderia ubonensis TaxID=101571 RepID=A0A117XMB7_9BURK|nr:hypothetical protein [Burkholderia ubonensis]KUZ77605.1 hypothetical protein WI35_05255 [Burkholderia ubonensis]KUZ83461.1 hypothetical protein WI38_27915 [Burkholderia ubonensis]KUZ95193.1 hypothetical protein WI39_14525 [Burkholderia ubonensis]
MSMVVIKDRAALMQRLMDAVIQGYHSYTSGTVKTERVHALCEKFSERYLVALNRNQLAYRRAKGLGNARLILADLGDPNSLHWWLLVTDGAHPAREREKGSRKTREDLKDALKPGERIHVSGYELLKMAHAKAVGGGVRLTWRMTDETKRQWRYQIRVAVRARHADDAVARVTRLMYKAPRFDSIKAQVDKLADFLRAEWGRTGHDVQLLSIPAALKPIPRVASDGIPVAEWIAAQMPEQAA